jgi:EmrB/QacA subfamily drug resistance transporter
VFVAGILIFTLASFLGGLATSSGWLLAARALQGVGGAIAAPTALALITTDFAQGPERNRAFGVFGAVAGAGGALGLLAGGMLASWLSWRWVLFVNVPIGVLLAALAPLYLAESERQPGRFDLAGALTSTAGMTALVYGFISAAQDGWSSLTTVGSFTAAAVLLAAFFRIETRTRQPITPLHLFVDRDRAGSYAIMLSLAAAMFGMFFFLTLFVRDVLGYSPLRAGLSFLPVTAAIILSSQFAARSLSRLGPRRLMTTGALLAVAGLAWLTQVSVTSGYLDGLLAPMLVFAIGMGLLFVPLTVVAVSGVPPHEAGAASSLLNVTQQVGGSLGLSILVTAFGTASRNEATRLVGQFLATAPPEAQAQFQQTGQLPAPWADQVLAHGISTSFQLAVVFAALALAVALVVIRAATPEAVESPSTYVPVVQGWPAWAAGARAVRTWPVACPVVRRLMLSSKPSCIRQSAASMNSVCPSSPPRVHANPARSSGTVSSTSPPSATRRQAGPVSVHPGVHTAPSVSRTMPSPGSGAHTRRFDRLPSGPMSNAVRVPPNDSETISVELSGVTAIPLGNAIPSATRRTTPSGVSSTTNPGASPSPGWKSAPPLT